MDSIGAMEVGKMDRKGKIQRNNTTTQNQYGEQVDNWQDLYTNLWAEKDPKIGRERYQADQLTGVQTVHFLIYWRSGIENGQLYVDMYDNITYYIRSTVEIGRRRYLLLVCEYYEQENLT